MSPLQWLDLPQGGLRPELPQKPLLHLVPRICRFLAGAGRDASQALGTLL